MTFPVIHKKISETLFLVHFDCNIEWGFDMKTTLTYQKLIRCCYYQLSYV